MPRPNASRLSSPWLAATLMFVMAAAGATAIIWYLEQDRLQWERVHVAQHARDHAHVLERHIERALSATYALAALVYQGKGKVSDFEILADTLLQLYPGVSALALAPDGVIRHVFPLEGHEEAIGQSILKKPDRRTETLLALDTHQLTLAGPFPMIQGGIGAIGRLPVFLNDELGNSTFWGFTGVVLRFPDALEPARLFRLVEMGFAYELWRIHPDTGQKQIIAASSPAALIAPVDEVIQAPNARWTLSVSPMHGWTNPRQLAFWSGAGLLFSLLAAYLAKLLMDLRIHRRQLERLNKEIRQSEERYRGLAEDMPALICSFLPDSTLTYVNQAYCDYLGKPCEVLLGQRFLDFLPEQSAQAVKASYLSQTPGEPTRTHQHLVLINGEIRWHEWTDRAFFNAQGEMTYLQGIGQDITERKRIEAELRIAAIAFESQEGMVVTDAEDVILRVNQAFVAITGYTAEATIGQQMSLLKSDRHDATFFKTMRERLQHTGKFQGEVWNRKPSGEIYLVWLTITAVKDDRGVMTHYVGTLTDITERKKAEEEIKNLAFYDQLTQLPNRRLLLDRLHQATAASARNRRHGALLFIDLDNFKTLNDTFGHDQGDLLLQQVAQRLSASVRENDTVARLGGDEFVVMLDDLSGNAQEAVAQTQTVGEKILNTLNQPYWLAGQEHHSTPSIGVTLFNHRQETVNNLLKQADLAMYAAKAAGRNTMRFFENQ